MSSTSLPASCGTFIAAEVFELLDECRSVDELQTTLGRETPFEFWLEKLTLTEIAHRLEMRFGIVIPAADLSPEATVGTVLDLVLDQLTNAQ